MAEFANHWTNLSIELATQRDYLDRLFEVYPLATPNFRAVDHQKWKAIKAAFESQQDNQLVEHLTSLSLKNSPLKTLMLAFFVRSRKRSLKIPRPQAAWRAWYTTWA